MAKNRKPKASAQAEKPTPLIHISEEEQWRIIQETGILKTASELPPSAVRPRQAEPNDADEPIFSPFAEELFATTALLIPISFLLLMMYILIHFQYGQHPDYRVITERMLSGVPILAVFIFYSKYPSPNRYKRERWDQLFLFLLSITAGSRMIYQVNHANWLVNMTQCPPLGTLWVYTIVQLDLGPAVAALVVVGVWVWVTGQRLVFD
ncbi:hypothetical protein BV25DRAFT_1986615 [Artomyces pyxidatus]|uniref:Uncharacterized protein n=1 Tax=Artomyces pyxidatus TaxID=48021 RepID=A0ACB8TL20_9AGAM|nr:hypothetical protein BV25DRAFT_1986615 [Artomyces pyxidatus]